MSRKLFLVIGAVMMLSACTNSPLGPVQDHTPDPAEKGAPWPTCAPKDSPACVGQ